MEPSFVNYPLSRRKELIKIAKALMEKYTVDSFERIKQKHKANGKLKD